MSFIYAYLLPVFRVSSLKCLFLPKRVWRYLWNIVTYSFPMHLCSTSWKHQKTVRLILGGTERVYWKQTTRLQIFQGVIWFVWEKMLLSQLSYIWEQSEICGRQPSKNLSLSRPCHFKRFKGCLPLISLVHSWILCPI